MRLLIFIANVVIIPIIQIRKPRLSHTGRKCRAGARALCPCVKLCAALSYVTNGTTDAQGSGVKFTRLNSK